MDPVLDEGIDSFEQAVEVGAVSLGEVLGRHPSSLPPRTEHQGLLICLLPRMRSEFRAEWDRRRARHKGLRWIGDAYLSLGEMETRGLKQP
jgi:hypothetical protein